MRIRGLLIAALVLLVLGGAVYWSNKTEQTENGEPDADAPPKILSIAEDQFQQFEIRKDGGAATVLRKSSAGKWQMLEPEPLPVDQGSAEAVVATLSSLTSGRLVEENVADITPFGLESPSLEITITTRQGRTRELLIGDQSPAGGGYFARLAGDPRLFTIASFTKTSLDKSPLDLRDKRLLTIDSEKLSRIELVRPEGGVIEFGKNSQNDWQILRPRPLRADGGKVEELIRKLKEAQMDISVSPQDTSKMVSAYARAARVSVVRVTDAGGTQQLEVRRDKDNTYYAASSIVEGIHGIGSDLGEDLGKGLTDFRNQKLFDFGWASPTRIEIVDGERRAVYEKSNDRWLSGDSGVGSAAIQDLLDRLRDLSSVRFLDQDFAEPFFQVAVTSNEGKRQERVLIAKQGDSYFARREDEPTIYELDGEAVEELQKTAAAADPQR